MADTVAKDGAVEVPFGGRGVDEATAATLQRHFQRFRLEGGRLFAVQCRHCPWKCTMTGVSRAIEHFVHQTPHPTVDEVRKHVLKRGLSWTEDKAKSVRMWRSAGQRTLGCPAIRCAEEELLVFARQQKLAAARMWVSVLGLGRPSFVEDDKPAELVEKPARAVPPFEPEDAQMQHVLAVVVSFGTFRSLECPVLQNFLSIIQPQYAAPGRTAARGMLDVWAERITAKMGQHIAHHGPWALMTDGATVRRSPFINIIVRNCRAEELLLAHVPTKDQQHSVHYLASLVEPLLEKHPAVVSVVADNASNVQGAAKAVASRMPDRRLVVCGCGEHAAQLLAGDVYGIYTWLDKAVRQAHAAAKHLRRKKRLYDRVSSSGRLTIVRKTRHNSKAMVVKSFLKVRPVVASLMAEQCWTDAFKKPGTKAALAQRAWTCKPLQKRLERAQPFVDSLASLSRKTAAAALPELFNIWASWRDAARELAKRTDFTQRDPGELDAVKGDRHAAFEACVKGRLEKHVPRLARGAAVFDARWLQAVEEPPWWQEAKTEAHHAVLAHFYDGVALEDAARDLASYLERDDAYAHGMPASTDDRAAVVLYWKQRQPSKWLREVALRLWCTPCSQGATERAWATANRQAQVIRSRMSSDTAAQLQLVQHNHWLVSGVAQDVAKKPRRVGMPAETAVANEAEADLCEASSDEDMTSESSSSTSSDD